MKNKLWIFFLFLASPAFAGTTVLQWEYANETTCGFVIERRLSQDSFFLIAGYAKSTERIFRDQALPLGIGYCYRIRAFNRYGQSSPSSEVCGVVNFLDQPSSIPDRPLPPIGVCIFKE